MSHLPNSNMVAIRASRFSDASPSGNPNSGGNCFASSHPRGQDRSYGQSSDASQAFSRPSSYYGLSGPSGSGFQNVSSGIVVNEQNHKINRNNGFQHVKTIIHEKVDVLIKRKDDLVIHVKTMLREYVSMIMS